MDSALAPLFLTHSSRKLEQMTSHIETCLSKLGDDLIWARKAGHENTVGNLVLHLEGNVRQWIIHGIGGVPDVRQRDLEFSTDSGLTVGALSSHIRKTANEAMEIIAGLSPARLAELTTPQHSTVSVLEAVYQVVGHFQQHTGQIMFATKQLTGDGLGFYQPPPPPASPA
ncbi:MAG: DUF1572 family protein [Bryobacteraceae bacterium]